MPSVAYPLLPFPPSVRTRTDTPGPRAVDAGQPTAVGDAPEAWWLRRLVHWGESARHRRVGSWERIGRDPRR